jgi:hypothetical protein
VERNAVDANPSNPPGSDGTFSYRNSPGAVPIGDNSGAFARGFTTGADMFAVSFDSVNHTATIMLDQRVDGFGDLADFQLYDAAGNNVGQPTNVSIPSFPNPGPVAISMDVPASVFALHPTQLQLSSFCSLFTGLPSPDACSIPQIVRATGTAVHIKTVKAVNPIKAAKHAKKHKKHHKRHVARKAHRTHKR